MFHEPTLTNTEIAAMLGVSVRTLQRLYRAGQGPKDRTRAGLVEWIKSKETAAHKEASEELSDNEYDSQILR